MTSAFAAVRGLACESPMGPPLSSRDRVGPVDCHISADPVAFLIVAYGRGSQWPPILRGKITAWGRKPWRAFGLMRLLVNP